MVQKYITIKSGTNREIKNMLQAEDIAKFIKSLQLRMCGHVEIMQNLRKPKQISTGNVSNTEKRKTTKNGEKFEAYLSILRTKTGI
jgi:hypothetical protein